MGLQDASKRIYFQPEVYEIIEEQREVVACKNQCEASMQTAKAPKRFLLKAGVTESFTVNIIVSKFDDRQPLYHSAIQLMPLYNLMVNSLIGYDI